MARTSRYRPRVAVATPLEEQLRTGARDLIRFDALRTLQTAADRRISIASPVAGLDININLTGDQMAAIDAKPTLGARARRMVRNAADGIVREAQKISKRTYDTGLFISSWRAKTDFSDEGRFKILVSNTAPYASYVKRAGADWKAGRTVVDTYIMPMIRTERKRLIADLKSAIVQDVKSASVKRKAGAA